MDVSRGFVGISRGLHGISKGFQEVSGSLKDFRGVSFGALRGFMGLPALQEVTGAIQRNYKKPLGF